MSLSTNNDSAVSKIDQWYRNQCNGTWEHDLGVTIETTDNPGWLVTFDKLKLNHSALADVIGDLLRKYGAQVTTDGQMVRVFAETLPNCLAATAVVIGLDH